MPSIKDLVILLSLTPSLTYAAPFNDGSKNSLMKRYGDGSSEAQAKKAVFDTEGWEDLAEMNCFIMLCVLGGKRTLSV
jgi:hypothetical protein